MFRLTHHVRRRIKQRHIPTEAFYDALFNGRRVRRRKQRNREIRYDRTTRWAVVVDPLDLVIITAYRLTKRQVRSLNERRGC